MRKLFGHFVAGGAIFLVLGGGANAADIAGSKDPTFLKRYEGSSIIAYLTQSYDRYAVEVPDPAKPPSGHQSKTVEGQITRIVYQTGPDHTPLELLRNYEAALEEAGFTRSLELTEKEADPRGFACGIYKQSWQPGDDWYDLSCAGIKQMGYVSATGNKDGKDITLAVMVVNFNGDRDMTYQGQKFHFAPTQATVVVDVVAAKAVDIKMVQVKATDMADALASKGTVDLYGILFDTDKTAIKPESDKTLDEVGTLLKIDPSRLQAKGYGDTKPVALNDNDANKAKNRRVELRKI